MSLMLSMMTRYLTPAWARTSRSNRGESRGAGGVVEDAVAADAFVEDAEVVSLLVGLEAAGENVGPAGVGVAGAVGPRR